MSQRTTGRHRRPGRLTTTSTALTRSAAVAATSTGLVAGAAVSATANPDLPREQGETLLQIGAGLGADRAITVDRPARAAAAPEDIELESFGTSGFSAVAPVVEAPPVEAQPAAQAQEASAEQTQAAEQVASRDETSASRDNERTEAPAEQAQPQQAEQQAAPAPSGGILGIAAAYTGIMYVYGGSTPAGFDCSGYTQFVFAQAGISIPRTAAAQQAAATPVSNPQPGDLVFYGWPAYHVGIYAGNGMMYDSGRPGIPSQYRAIFSGVSGYGRVG